MRARSRLRHGAGSRTGARTAPCRGRRGRRTDRRSAPRCRRKLSRAGAAWRRRGGTATPTPAARGRSSRPPGSRAPRYRRAGRRGGSRAAAASVAAAESLRQPASLASESPVRLSRAACSLLSFSGGSTDLGALDREALEVGAWIVGIENLAVEEGLLAARGRGRNLVGRHTEILCGLAPKVLAVHLLDERLGIEVRFELAPADVFGEEPELVALERVGREVIPVAHDVR